MALTFKDANGLHECKIIKSNDSTCVIEVYYLCNYGSTASEKVLSAKRHKGVLFLDGVCIL